MAHDLGGESPPVRLSRSRRLGGGGSALDRQIRCEFYIPDTQPLFNALHKRKDSIESKLPHELEWMELEGKKASRIRTIHTIDVSDNINWEASFQWLMDSAQQFQAVFADELKKIKI